MRWSNNSLLIKAVISERTESMLMGINNSHRVIILLNENFLKDDWNKAIIQQVHIVLVV